MKYDLLRKMASFFYQKSSLKDSKTTVESFSELKSLDFEAAKTIYPRTHDFNDDATIFHYCSPETFLNIIQYKTLRFSDIYAMNDFTEMRWGLSILDETISILKAAISE
jgi:hypothetical protein